MTWFVSQPKKLQSADQSVQLPMYNRWNRYTWHDLSASQNNCKAQTNLYNYRCITDEIDTRDMICQPANKCKAQTSLYNYRCITDEIDTCDMICQPAKKLQSADQSVQLPMYNRWNRYTWPDLSASQKLQSADQSVQLPMYSRWNRYMWHDLSASQKTAKRRPICTITDV